MRLCVCCGAVVAVRRARGGPQSKQPRKQRNHERPILILTFNLSEEQGVRSHPRTKQNKIHTSRRPLSKQEGAYRNVSPNSQ
ncbi:hypothetical protein CC77DRAFT_952508 [Alternaria alternata]|uniref:Uncharacterized protein n=1 Tax=Alternaria alternata TaxID=5599 RepID=A0A177E3W1_ALTAL|nr:hypothetical protein CC77DRAFT_952508 [Alternaria alternata]OAG26110.1 hypothetical protein CC77DRAFT_952508 [Alternaria alternata]